MISTDLIVILGPTASGKTKLAVNLADKLNSEIISADSRQVYKHMNIGTGKDLHEFSINGRSIPYHLINIIEAGDKYNIHEFQKDFSEAFQLISLQNKIPILCGGTGLYIESVLKNFQYTSVPIDESLRSELKQKSKDELLKLHNQITSDYTEFADTSTVKRLIRAIEISTYLNHHAHEQNKGSAFNSKLFGIDVSREVRRQRITDRLHQRMAEGMIEEVQMLLDKGIEPEKIIYYGLEYKFITLYLLGELSLDEMTIRLENAIHQFAKRQMTYFRKMEKDGLEISWIDGEQSLEMQLKELLSQLDIPY